MFAAQPSAKRILVVEDNPELNGLLVELLRNAGYAVRAAMDGAVALRELEAQVFDLVLLDLGLPNVSGIQILEDLRRRPDAPKVIVVTGDDTSETILRAVKEQAYSFIAKPATRATFLEAVQTALARNEGVLPIEVVSAKTDWVELVVPCQLEIADRIESFMQGLNARLSSEVRDAMSIAFRELLMNAIEWGGKLDPARKVRIACIRSDRMLLYRIQDPGSGFDPSDLQHAAVSNEPDQPYSHLSVRSAKGLRPGGFGLMLTRISVDELIYNEAHNEVVFIKYLSQQEVPPPRLTQPNDIQS